METTVYRVGYFYRDKLSTDFIFVDERDPNTRPNGILLGAGETHETQSHADGQRRHERILFHVQHERLDMPNRHARYYAIVGPPTNDEDLRAAIAISDIEIDGVTRRMMFIYRGWGYLVGDLPIGGTVRGQASAEGTGLVIARRDGDDDHVVFVKSDDAGQFGVQVIERSSPTTTQRFAPNQRYYRVSMDGLNGLPAPQVVLENPNNPLDRLLAHARTLAGLVVNSENPIPEVDFPGRQSGLSGAARK